MPSKTGLIEAARAYIEAVCPEDDPQSIEIRTRTGLRLVIEIPANGYHGNGRGPAMPLPCRGLSPIEDAILKALTTAEPGVWVTAETLARDTKQRKSTSFTDILANLAEAGVVESTPGRGYRLPVSPTNSEN